MIIETVGPDKAKREEVFGTIHVERNDGLPPSEEDILDLLEFGRQMAAAAMQSERVHVLLTTLHSSSGAKMSLKRRTIKIH